MDVKALERALDQERAASVYLLVGSDVTERSHALTRLQSRFVDPKLAEWCVISVDGTDATGSDVLDMVSTPPFIGDRRVVIVRSAQALVDEEALAAYVESPADFSVLVLVADAVDKRRKLYQLIKKHGIVMEFETPAAEQMPAIVARMAKERHVALDPAAAALLSVRAGDDMSRVRSELEKLALYAGDGGRVTLEEADRLVARGLPTLGQYAIFDFVDALAEGNGALALRRLDELLRCGEPALIVLTMIARQFRLLLAALAWQGGSPKALAKEMGLRSEYPAKKAFGQARRWSHREVTDALDACAACDAAMKRGVDGRRALEALTIRLACRIAGPT